MSQKLKITALALALALAGYLVIPELSWDAVPSEPTKAEPHAAGSAMQQAPAAAAESNAAERTSVATEEEAQAPVTAPVPSLAGTVLTPDGLPATATTVVIGALADLKFIDLGKGPPEGLVWTTTDEEGRFAFFDRAPGLTKLTASSKMSAPSETLSVQLEQGAPQIELTLTLRKGVRIHGEVWRKDGSLAKLRKLRFLRTPGKEAPAQRRLVRNIVTDELGRFDEQHLCPGNWGLVSFPTEEDIAELGGTMPEHMVQATIELADGEEQFIVLGARSAEAVIVTGLILSGAQPTKAIMQWIRECPDPMGSQRIARVGPDGRYEVELPNPGAWFVRLMGSSAANEEYYLDIPAQPRFEHDFKLPTSRITGHIFNASGDPVEGAQVSHVLTEGRAHRSPLAAGMDRYTSDKDGSYRLRNLSPGVYQIGVTHPTQGTAALAHIVVGAGATVAGIDLLLEADHELSGLVLDASGDAVAGAPIWIHGEGGSLMNPISRIQTDKQGRFKTPPLPCGSYMLISQVGVLVAQSAELHIAAEAPESVELHLAAGAKFIVTTLANGQPARAHIRVYDLDGRLYTGLRSSRDPWSWQRYPFDSLHKHVGPLPSGTYRVSAHIPGSGTVEREITVTPGEERELRLEL